MAILNRFSAMLLYCDSARLLLFAADFLGIPGQRFWAWCNLRFCATKLGAKAPRTKFWHKFRRHGQKMQRKFGEIFRRFSSFNFQEKWARDISRKILDKFHEPKKTNAFHRETLGAGGAQH